MPLFRRPDGNPVRDAPTLRRILPFIMPVRSASLVYFDQQIDVTRTLEYIAQRNAGKSVKAVSLFDIFVCAAVQTLAARPQLNRFIVGRRLYQRSGIQVSFAVKKGYTDNARLTTVKAAFDHDHTLEAVSRTLRETVTVGRGERETGSETEMRVVTRLPRSLLRAVVWGQRVLDYFNLLPAAMIQNDPLYASLFVANLGSIGIDAAYHHLYDYGTVSIFFTIGRIKKAAVVENGLIKPKDVVDIRATFDERIADGFYSARSLELFCKLVEDPQRLQRPPYIDPSEEDTRSG